MSVWQKKPFWFDERVDPSAPDVLVRCSIKHRDRESAWACGARWMRNRTKVGMPPSDSLGLTLYRYDPDTGRTTCGFVE